MSVSEERLDAAFARFELRITREIEKQIHASIQPLSAMLQTKVERGALDNVLHDMVKITATQATLSADVLSLTQKSVTQEGVERYRQWVIRLFVMVLVSPPATGAITYFLTR